MTCRLSRSTPTQHEQREARALVQWADQHWWGELLVHMPNERPNRLHNGILAGLGVRRGWPDYTLYVPRGKYPGLCFELKAAPPHSAPLSGDQRIRLTRLQQVGYCAGMVKGWDRARALIEAYLSLPGFPWGAVPATVKASAFDWFPGAERAA